MSELRGRRALVTGASAGIGHAFANHLGALGADLVLTARRGDRLRATADLLSERHGITVDTITADLAAPDGAGAVWAAATASAPVDLLVNNAGFGSFRAFATTPWSRDLEMLQLNITALVELCHHFVSAHRARTPRGPGHILNVASLAAFQAVPNFASYAATKAYVLSLSEALHYELADDGIVVTCLCPGGTHTEFHAAAGSGNYGRLANASMLSAEAVAEVGVRALLRGKKTVVPGLLNKLSVALGRLAPSGVRSRSAAAIMGSPRAGELPPRHPGSGESI
ncbi:MAG: SDR family oxidoreductase [Kofleriaceae bacterium]